MAAGDLVVADYQLEIRALLTGCDTDYDFGPNVIMGLGEQPPKTRDFVTVGQAGAIGAGDRRGVRIIQVDYQICQPDDVGAAITALRTLATAWQPTSDPDGLEMHFQLPGIGHKYVVGFPRGLDADEGPRLYLHGVVSAIAEFHAMDAVIHDA